LIRIYNPVNNNKNPLNFETRRVQSNGRPLITVLSKLFIDELGILKCDPIKSQDHTANKKKIMIKLKVNEAKEA
jgi:hypothetical protein